MEITPLRNYCINKTKHTGSTITTIIEIYRCKETSQSKRKSTFVSVQQ